ncbi:MAG: serpin family protein [Eubacteriales bacterium]|nr:serpin family protein [Eubacteriales bacterium]
MMKKRITAVMLCMSLAVSSLFSFTAIGAPVQENDLMNGITAQETDSSIDISAGNTASVDFAVRLFQATQEKGKNTMISPVSVLYALAMTANGAKGDTLSQMEEVLGMPVSELNDYLHTYAALLPSEEKCRLDMANSIWFKQGEDFIVNPDFLQTNADYYNAGVYEGAFDSETLDEINSWVRDKTDGMIDSILEEIPEKVVMYLINAVCFDAQWSEIYSTDQIRQGRFKLESGDTRETEFMHSEESRYLEDGGAKGFLKYYAGKKYAFAALLPDESMSVKSYADSLTGEHLMNILDNAQETTVEVSIPKFKSEYDIEMSKILKNMGMTDAFSKKADLSGLGESRDRLFISRVLHKTYIDVDEKGTKAAGVTAVEICLESAMEEVGKQVFLDRPFLYMIIDCENSVPLFIGAMMDVG